MRKLYFGSGFISGKAEVSTKFRGEPPTSNPVIRVFNKTTIGGEARARVCPNVSISPPIYFTRSRKMFPSRFTAPDTIYSALVRGGSHTSPMGVYYRNVLKHCGHKEVGLNLDTLPVSTRKIRA